MKKFNCKRLIALLLAVIVLSFSILSVSAMSSVSFRLMVDEEGIFTEDEVDTLADMLWDISSRHQCNVVAVTSEDFDGMGIEAYSKSLGEFFDQTGYYGTILMTVSQSEREYYVYTTEGVGGVFTESVREDICDNFLPDLKAGDYYGAVNSFSEDCDTYLTRFAETGSTDAPTTLFDILFYLVIALVVGFVIALVVVLIMKGQLKSVRFEAKAHNYIKEGSFKLNESSDTFLYRTVTRTAKPKETSSGGSSSRSGSAGGTGGKF